ncbi:hypothetical protein ACHAXT_012193 [Thalassiosira profunda]
MLENQAFGWLKNAIKGSTLDGGTSNAAALIRACSDPAVLVQGVAGDFRAALADESAHSEGPPAAAAATAAAPVAPAAADAPATAELAGEEPPSSNDGVNSNGPLDDLTARLDRIKILLYEERSASSAAAQQSGAVSLNWTPAVATAVYKGCTAPTTTETEQTEEGAATTNIGEEEGLMPQLIQHLPLLPFEARKSVSAIFNYLLVCGLDGVDRQQFASISTAFAGYVLERADHIIDQLVRAHYCKPTKEGADGVDIALLCGSMLRSSLRHAPIYRWVLADANCERLVYPFLDGHVHNPNFDLGSDALETVRVMLTGATGGGNVAAPAVAGVAGDHAAEEEYKQQMEGIASDFLTRKYTEVIDERINKKCLSPKANYMTRRMTLQLLSSILLNRANYQAMMQYISSQQNLVTILCLLRDPSPHITLDAFQVFKIFVANPHKPPEVVQVLYDNKAKLVKYLDGLHKEREGSDEQYRDEKRLVVSTLEGLEVPEA